MAVEWRTLPKQTTRYGEPAIAATVNSINFNAAARELLKGSTYLVVKIGYENDKPTKIGFIPATQDTLDSRHINVSKTTYKIYGKALVKLIGVGKKLPVTVEDDMLVVKLA